MTQKAIYPKLKIVDNFLGEKRTGSLFDFVRMSLESFGDSVIGPKDAHRIDKSYRQSIVFRPRKSLSPEIRQEFESIKNNYRNDIGIEDFDISKFEVEIAIHKDGGFYKRHIDTHTGQDAENIRIMTAVYYFHRTPRTFEGGQIRFFPIIGGQEGEHLDISPDHDQLLIFPSFFPHEVLPVSSPVNEFDNWRFSVNLWFNRARTPAG